MRGRFIAAFAAAFLFLPGVAAAQERSAVKPGFEFAKDHQVSIVIYRPDVHVGTLTTGGIDEPNADWTAAARGLMADALKSNGKVADTKIIFADEPEGDDGAYLAEYRALFGAVANAIEVNKLFGRLPTKKTSFDWTLGDGVGRIGKMSGADYALFLFTHDAYGSAGRKAAQLLGAMFLGVYIPPGVHIGYAGLVDLKTGDVIWLNADAQMGGDVRTPEGAAKRVTELLKGLPGRVEPVVATPAK